MPLSLPSLLLLRRRHRKHQPQPAYTPLPSPASPLSLSSNTPVWASPSQTFTGIHDPSLYDDMLDLLLSTSQDTVPQRSAVGGASETEAEAEGEVLFDADVWVELARAEEETAKVLRCQGCEWDGEREMQELRRLTEAFVREYYDGECGCLESASGKAVVGVPGENFGVVEECCVSYGEAESSFFDRMDDVVEDLWADTGIANVLTVDDCVQDVFYDPPTPGSIILHMSEYEQDVMVLDVSEMEEALRSGSPLKLCYFDADAQQYFDYAAFNQQLACYKSEITRFIIPEPSVRTRNADSYRMY